MSRSHDMDRFYGQRPTLFIQPLSQPATSLLDDDEVTLELDEPPDHHYIVSPQSYSHPISRPAVKTADSREYTRQHPVLLERKSSLLTQGLLTTTSSQDANTPLNGLMARAGSQASAYSLTSNHGLTSDGGFSSPAHSGTPSPPLPTALQGATPLNAKPPKTIKFAGEREMQTSKTTASPAPPIRKTCISFACGPSKMAAKAPQQPQAPVENSSRRPCTISFACGAKSTEEFLGKTLIQSKKQTLSDIQSMPRRAASPFPSSRKHRGSQSTPKGATLDGFKRNSLGESQQLPSDMRKIEKERLKRLGSTRPEDEAWMNEKPRERKPITVTYTLRKENAIRQLAAEAEQEALEDAMDDIIDEEEDDGLATGSRYMAFDEDESDGGHETDDEGGFAESDDDTDDDPEFQFWTVRDLSSAAEQHAEMIRPRHARTVSESSFDSAFKPSFSSAVPVPPSRHRVSSNRRALKNHKMRPGTPELPDSTDFVCGTLDEDKPLEEAYLSCLKQRKLEKQGVIPQDLDPSFPTSDPENNDEDEITEGVASTASDHHFLGGRFDESDSSQHRGRDLEAQDTEGSKRRSSAPRKSKFSRKENPDKSRTKMHAPVAMQRIRTKSPAPVAMQRIRTKSPAPVAMQRLNTQSPIPNVAHKAGFESPAFSIVSRLRDASLPPGNLFGRSPVSCVSPLPVTQVQSPPASPKDIKIQTSGLAERPGHVKTASLPHTPNPFFIIQERRLRARKKITTDNDNHDRGPIDIKQGLEERKQRRKEHYWRKHCRDHKDKSRRCAPGKGAERMRELGLEMAHRNKAYGQKLELMLSV